ncbi:MAG: hypothetical protein ACI97A_002410 [Planctomycetota bacterium]
MTDGKFKISWNKAIKDAVQETQRQEGNFKGSWDPMGAWGSTGYRLYSKSIMALTLAVPYASWIEM